MKTAGRHDHGHDGCSDEESSASVLCMVWTFWGHTGASLRVVSHMYYPS